MLVVFLSGWFQNCCLMAEKKLCLTHYYHGKNYLGVEMALGRSCQLSSERDHCTDVYFLWGQCHHQSGGHDMLHPQISAACGKQRCLLWRVLSQKISPQSSLEGAVPQAGVTRAVGCWLWPPSLALRSSFRPSLWLSLCPGSHTWNVYVGAAGRKRGWCSPAHKKRIHEVQTANENGCCPRALATSTHPSFLNAWLWFGASPECPRFGYFSPRG